MSSKPVTDISGNKFWYNENNEYHRLDGPAVEYNNGVKHWFKNDKFHRLDGPAIERANGTKCWYVEGKRHRIDGPAIEFGNGDKSWYYHGEKINCNSTEEFVRLVNLRVFW